MKVTKFSTYINEQVEDPFYNHKLRMEKGYRPKYKSGLIGVHFVDDEVPFGSKYKNVDDKGKYRVNYDDLFSYDKDHRSDFVQYFMNKYNLQYTNYRKGSSDYHIYFKCKPGEEQEIMKRIAKEEIVKDIDYVDARALEGSEELEDIAQELNSLSFEYGEMENNKMRRKIQRCINRLHELI
jgi:hypothetical protein